MQSYNARHASFSPPHRTKSSAKGPQDLRWPHPASFLATPTSLAAAGFYFNPSSATPDAVSCFLCDKGLADWDPDDDPARIHAEKCPKCPWAILRSCRLIASSCSPSSLTFSSSRLPASRTMEKARLATFGPDGSKWWPHGGKNKGPTSKMMSKAGFIFIPADNKDDTCTCIYCGIELSGWQPEDDPMEEHRSRQAKNGPCPFFTEPDPTLTAKKRVRAKSKQSPITPTASSSDQEYQPPGTKSSTRSSNSKQPSKRTDPKDPDHQKRSRSRPPPRAEEAPTRSRAKPTGKGKGKANAGEAVEEDRGRSKGKSKAITRAVDLNADAQRVRSPRESTKDRTRKSSKSAARYKVANEEPAQLEPAKTRKKANASSSIERNVKGPDDEASPEQLRTLSPPSQSPSAGAHRTVPVPVARIHSHKTNRRTFQSPEDEEFAREEEALEEQARELMLAGATFEPSSNTPFNNMTRDHHRPVSHVPSDNPTAANYGQGKAMMASADVPVVAMVVDGVISTIAPPTSPSLAAAIANAVSPSVMKSPQLVPDNSTITLSDAERMMTVEEWVRHEMNRQYELLQSDGRQKIDAFKARAVEVARQIEGL